MNKLRYISITFLCISILLSSCKTTSKCDAYSTKDDIQEQHLESQKKYCSVETIK
jgi:hypothetical protein